jgi:hypothetical protein
MKKFEYWHKKAARMRLEGVPLEQVLGDLRREGASIVDSIKIVRLVESIQLGQAKKIIDQSDVWADRRDINRKIRLAAERVLSDSDDFSS